MSDSIGYDLWRTLDRAKTWLVIQVQSTLKSQLNYHDRSDGMRSIKKSKQNNDVIDLISVISIEYKNEMSRLIRQCQFYDEEETGQWRDRSNVNDRTCLLNTENETELSYPIQQGIIYNKDQTGQRCDWSYKCDLHGKWNWVVMIDPTSCCLWQEPNMTRLWLIIQIQSM